MAGLDTSTPSFYIASKFDDIDLDALSKLFKKGQFFAKGRIKGRIYVKGTSDAIDKIDIKLDSLEPGGEIRTVYLGRLISFIPQNSVREAIAETLKGDLFVFKKANIEMLTNDRGHNLHILLDGQHLLDFNINVPKDTLNDTLNKLKGRR